MISAGRILTIFRRKGGSGEFTKTVDELPAGEVSMIREALNGEDPLIVSVRSMGEWFAFTKSRLVSKRRSHVLSIPLPEVDGIVRPGGVREFAQGKLKGGMLEVRLRDGSRFSIDAESPAPFVALTNIFMYLIKVNCKSTGLGLKTYRP